MEFIKIYEMADRAGKNSAANVRVEPMYVNGGGIVYKVDDGLCGFAEITFKGNTAWGRWTKKLGIAKKNYNGGLYIWVSDYNQSVTRKEAYAKAFVSVLIENGIEANYSSRLD